MEIDNVVPISPEDLRAELNEVNDDWDHGGFQRAEALRYALKYYEFKEGHARNAMNAPGIVEIAKVFEAYLTGASTNG